jgi:integrase
MQDVDVATARAYIMHVRSSGRANKTLRNLADTLGHIWRAIDQLSGGLHNPWQAARPDDDGSSVRLEAFSAEEEQRVLQAAKTIGCDWYLASIIARWTGLRYVDVATLEWCDIDFVRNVIDTIPNKTRKHKVRVVIPMSPPLREALLERSRTVAHDGFIMPAHGSMYPNAPEPPYSDALEAAGVDTKTHTFHSWRHTFRTRLAEAGVSDDVARRLGGWTNLKMAAHYDHASRLPELREAIDKMA